MTCVCPAQLQPHDRLPGACAVEAMDRGLPPECPRPWDPDKCYVWGGRCKACVPGEDDPRVQNVIPDMSDPWRDVGGEA